MKKIQIDVENLILENVIDCDIQEYDIGGLPTEDILEKIQKHVNEVALEGAKKWHIKEVGEMLKSGARVELADVPEKGICCNFYLFGESYDYVFNYMLKADSLFDDMICSYAIDENRASLVRLKTLLNEMDSTIDKTLKDMGEAL